MRFVTKDWFTEEARRAGWISALTNIPLFLLLGWSFGNTRSPLLPLLYPIFAMALGVVAVGALHWRRPHALRQSLGASLLAVLDVCGMIAPTVVVIAFLVPLRVGVIVLLYAFMAMPVYFVVAFPIGALLACSGGTLLHGLLLAMRFVARTGQMTF